MYATFRRFGSGSATLPVRLRWAVLGWLAAEAATFLLLVKLLGLGTVLLLGLGTTVLGFLMLRRAGMDAMQMVRRSLDGGAPRDGLSDGLLSGLGAVLLILPGFLLNAAGLILAAPSSRRLLLGRFGAAPQPRPGRPARPGVIDLDPSDWTPLDRR